MVQVELGVTIATKQSGSVADDIFVVVVDAAGDGVVEI